MVGFTEEPCLAVPDGCALVRVRVCVCVRVCVVMSSKPRSRSLDTASLQESGVRLLRLKLARRCVEAVRAPPHAHHAHTLPPHPTTSRPGSLAAPPPPNTARELSPARRVSARVLVTPAAPERAWATEGVLVQDILASRPQLRRHSLTPPARHAHHAHAHGSTHLLSGYPRPTAPPTPFLVDGAVQHFYSSEEWRAALEGGRTHARPGPQPCREAPAPPVLPDRTRSSSLCEDVHTRLTCPRTPTPMPSPPSPGVSLAHDTTHDPPSCRVCVCVCVCVGNLRWNLHPRPGGGSR